MSAPASRYVPLDFHLIGRLTLIACSRFDRGWVWVLRALDAGIRRSATLKGPPPDRRVAPTTAPTTSPRSGPCSATTATLVSRGHPPAALPPVQRGLRRLLALPAGGRARRGTIPPATPGRPR